MHVLVNGVRLFFDVEGAQLVPHGPRLRQRPTLILLHGGPGADHAVYRPQMAPLDDWLRICVPVYTQTASDPDVSRRGSRNAEATRWFSRADGGGSHFDLRAALALVQCPTLVLGGALDPMLPVENQRDIAGLLPQQLVQYHEFAHAGHGVVDDAPEHAMALLRDFVAAAGPPSTDSTTETTP